MNKPKKNPSLKLLQGHRHAMEELLSVLEKVKSPVSAEEVVPVSQARFLEMSIRSMLFSIRED